MWPRDLSFVKATEPTAAGYLVVEASAQLLAPFQRLTDGIRISVGVTESHWRELYLTLLHNYAALSQRLPASEAHHHAELGGLLRHGLETIFEALTLRRNHLLPAGAPAEEIASQQDLWTYATVTAALLHDVGKPITDLVVTYISPADTLPQVWQPLKDMLPMGAQYRFRFNPQRKYHRHALMPPLLVHRILPQVGLNWLASEPAVFNAWLATISGTEDAGPLATIAHAADGASVARDLSGSVRTRSPAARAKPLSERLLTGLRHMVKEGQVTLNRPGASGFVADGSLWLVSKRVLDDLREHLTKEGLAGIPGRNDRLMDELQQWHVIQPNGDKAVWYCDIQIGDWCQTLTCLRMDVTHVWASPKDVPTAIGISVTTAERSPDTASPGNPTDNEHLNLTPSSSGGQVPGESPSPNNASSRSMLPADSAKSSDPSETTSGGAAEVTCETPTRRLPDDSPQRGSVPDSEADIGRQFVEWLKENIRDDRVEINTARARVHAIPEGLALITPGIFRDFSPEHWDRAQKRFQKLKLHAKTEADTNIWTCQVAKDRKRSTVKVMLIPNAASVLGVNIPDPNPAMTLIKATKS